MLVVGILGKCSETSTLVSTKAFPIAPVPWSLITITFCHHRLSDFILPRIKHSITAMQ